jgi:hypothetical protein
VLRTNIFSRDEVAKYLPIGFVACIEGYFRLVFRDLIDYGSPFRENVINFRDIKFGVEHVVAIEGGKLSLGEFVSHFLPVNGIQDIDNSMSILLAHSFLDQLKAMEVKESDMPEPKPLNDILAVDVMLKKTQRLFELRHIYSHELAPKEKVNVKEIQSCTNWALLFLAYSENLVEQITKPAT